MSFCFRRSQQHRFLSSKAEILSEFSGVTFREKNPNFYRNQVLDMYEYCIARLFFLYYSYHSRYFWSYLHNHVLLVYYFGKKLRRECRYYFCYTYTNYLVVTSYLLAVKTLPSGGILVNTSIPGSSNGFVHANRRLKASSVSIRILYSAPTVCRSMYAILYIKSKIVFHHKGLVWKKYKKGTARSLVEVTPTFTLQSW